MCSVPGCVVSRNTLGKWRQAAVEHFLFPPSLPLTLHLCPEQERDRWMAEIDLDPTSRAKVVVCSLHFRDGLPTPDNPFPTELLGEAAPADGPTFRGQKPLAGGSFDLADWSRMEARRCSRLVLDLVLDRMDAGIEAIEMEKAEELQQEREREEQECRRIALVKNCLVRK